MTPADLLRLQRTAGNRAMSRAVRQVPQPSPAATAIQRLDLGKELSVFSGTVEFPRWTTHLNCGIDVSPKLAFTGTATVKSAGEHATTASMTTASPTFTKEKGSPTKGDATLAKLEVEQKLGSSTTVTGGLDVTTSGVEPSVELSFSTGHTDKSDADAFQWPTVGVQFGLWKFDDDSVALLPVTGSVKEAIKGTIGAEGAPQLELAGVIEGSVTGSIDPERAAGYLFKTYGPKVFEDASAVAPGAILVVTSLVGGAVLSALDVVNESRREHLQFDVCNRAHNIVSADATYLTVLDGRHKVTPVMKLAKEAADAANNARAMLAAKASLDLPTLTHVFGGRPEIIDPFQWREQMLDLLAAKECASLDAWAAAHPFKSLWGLETHSDKNNVYKWINAIDADPTMYPVGPSDVF